MTDPNFRDASPSFMSIDGFHCSPIPSACPTLPMSSYPTAVHPMSSYPSYYGQPRHFYAPTPQRAPTYRFSVPPRHLYRRRPRLLLPPTPEIVGYPVHGSNGLPTTPRPPATSEPEDIFCTQLQDSTAPIAQERTRPAGLPQRPTEAYKKVGWNCCALNPCATVAVVIVLVLLFLLGTASKLLGVLGEDYFDKNSVVGVKESVLRADTPNVTTSTTSTAQVSKGLVECKSDACLWETRYLLGKLNDTVDPCQDFYSHVCSSEWFKDERNISTHPFTYRASATAMLVLWDYLRYRTAKSPSPTFIDLAAVVLRGCVNGTKRDAEWSAFRGIFEDLEIPGWPYEDDSPDVEPYDVAKVTDKLLGTATFVTMSLRERHSDGDLELHMDSPPIYIRRYETLFPGQNLKTYGDFVFKVLSLWNPPSNATHKLAVEIVQLEQVMCEAAAHSARSVPIMQVTKPVVTFVSLRHWDWFLYISYFLQEVAPSISAGMVVLHDALYMDHLNPILSQTHSRTLINYIGYRLIVHMSPLLPASKAGFIVPLSHQFHVAEGVPERFQACMFLLERLYPFGVRSLLWSAVLTKSRALGPGEAGLAEDVRQIRDVVRFEMKQCAATAPWLSLNESNIATLKVDRMEIQVVPPDDQMSLPVLAFPQNTLEAGKLLLTYYRLLRFMRSQYWTARHPTLFREPSTPTESAYRPGFSYDPERNVMALSPATFFLTSGVSHSFEATSIPFLVALVRGMFAAMDIRGSTIDAEGTVRRWWSMSSEGKFLSRSQCLQGTFSRATREYLNDDLEGSLFLVENAADGAVLRPLYSIFLKLARREEVMATIPGQPLNVTFRKLFFINYATTFCEPQRTAAHSKRRLLFKVGVPPKLRVNVALSRFRTFAEVFNCASGTLMNPTHACTFW